MNSFIKFGVQVNKTVYLCPFIMKRHYYLTQKLKPSYCRLTIHARNNCIL